jgi:hypothetical protein
MKKAFLLFSLLAAILLFFMAGCQNDYPASIYDPGNTGNATPVITSISPANVGFAVADEIVINGLNFSTNPAENFVYFGKNKMPVTSCTSTQIKVQAPNVVSDSIPIKVAVLGAQLFSSPIIKYRLLPAFLECGTINEFDDPWSVEMDKNENIYVSLSLGNTSYVVKISPANVQTNFATCGFPYANSMKFGPDGSLYFARLIPIIYSVSANGGAATNYVTLPNAGKAYDMDFDVDGNMWVVGNNNFIYRVKPDKSIKSFDFVANLRTVRIYNGYIYTAGRGDDGNEYVWRNKIVSADEIGAREVVFEWSKNIPGPLPLSLTVSSDGNIYVGSDGPDSLAVVIINQSAKTYKPLYPAYMLRTGKSLTWGQGSSSKYLYMVRRNDVLAKRRVMKIYTTKDGAPYYGRK